MPKTPDQIFKDKISLLLKAEKRMDAQAVSYQSKLFDLLVEEYLPLFDVKDGIVLDSSKNLSLINSLDVYFTKLSSALNNDILGGFAANLLKSASMSGQYYEQLGFNKTVVKSVLKNKFALETRLGIQPSGKLKKSGYLYKLGQTEEVRNKLANYVINNLTGDTGFLDFQLGFRNLVKGNRRVKGLSTKGALQQYFDQYAYDSFNELDAVANKQLATQFNLKHFIYEGSIIDTTRAFCLDKAGKAFSVEEAEKNWPNDPNLIDKKTKASYKPLVERGRRRCRHFIKYITESTYNQIRV